jgi:hypothetical protein
MPVAEWEIRDFSEGLIDRVDDNLLPENVAMDCQNFISRRIGSLVKRAGQARLNGSPLGGPVQGMHAYYKGSLRRLVVVAGGVASYWDPGTSSFVTLKTGLDPSTPVCFETCVNYMVSFNGVNAPWKWDGTTVSTLLGAPGDGQFAVLHKEKLFTVPKSEPSTLRWSDSFQPETWQSVNYWDVKKGDGDVITNLSQYLSELAVFKRRSLHVLRGTNLDDFGLDEVDSRTGCVGPFAAVSYGPYLYFVSDEGICVFNGTRVFNLSRERIPDFWKSINKEYLHRAAAGVWDGLIWFALPEGGSSYNNVVLVYVPPEEGAVGGKFWVWRGINASCFQVYDDGTRLLFYSGDSTAGYVNQQDVGTDDFGSPIEAYWVGRTFAIGEADRKNRFLRAFVQDSPGANDVDLQVAIDYGPFESLVPDGGDALVRRYNFYNTYTGRYLQLKLTHSALGSCEVRGLKVLYKPMKRAS